MATPDITGYQMTENDTVYKKLHAIDEAAKKIIDLQRG